jgi:D-glycero-alpha-D-manno-heptose 1-phosphate guanylyltransferase
MEFPSLTTAILAGGLDTRLGSKVWDRPKVLADVGGRPFLTYLFDQLAGAGCRTVVLCTGYLGEQVAQQFGKNHGPLRLVYSQEHRPLDTGGALRCALSHIESDPLLVMNGDSYFDLDLNTFWNCHVRRQLVASIALARVGRSERYTKVQVDADARVTGFAENQDPGGPGWINAGIYVLGKELIRSIPEGVSSSLERDIFPRWVARGLIGHMRLGQFVDIGTPEGFAAAGQFFSGVKGRRFVVLDRDGTIIEEREYLSHPDQVTLIPGAASALRGLKQLGFGLAVVTNQSGIGLGLFDRDDLEQIHQRLQQLLKGEGVQLDGLYFCPHVPSDDCDCRKPRLGLMERAAKELGFDPQHSIVIGDKPSDIEMGRQVGALTFLVRTGYGAQFENAIAADFVVEDLSAASRSIGCLLGAEKTDGRLP